MDQKTLAYLNLRAILGSIPRLCEMVPEAKKLIEGKDTLTCAPLYYQGGEGEADEAAIDTYAICVTKGQTELLNAINEVLKELGKDGVQALVDKHLGL